MPALPFLPGSPHILFQIWKTWGGSRSSTRSLSVRKATAPVAEAGTDQTGDGYLDLILKFKTQELVDHLKLNQVAGETIPLKLIGNLKEEDGGMPIEGQDCVWVLKQGK